MLEALAYARQPVRVKFAGTADQPAYQDELKSLARKLRVQNRVEWLGQITEEENANCIRGRSRSFIRRSMRIMATSPGSNVGVQAFACLLRLRWAIGICHS